MPDAVWRISPARSISRCDTIWASAGFSFRVGRKLRDKRIRETSARQGTQAKTARTLEQAGADRKHSGYWPHRTVTAAQIQQRQNAAQQYDALHKYSS